MKTNDVHPKIIEELKKYPKEVQELVIDALQSFSQGLNQQEVQRKLENKMRRLLQEEAQG
ncbi:hypothetical protein [Paenibacillus sp. FSL R7-0331]|uniref:hypothetical protein n=1 Tax=Paenibacillus sp. FSL R7-0331 TaxID=1536773 RepID=UPI0004F89268|nr:hypothetical protein [Paenibacillus sp. FSL R7-0331]AIQ51733.1 hypothetical protein R70331_09530 [Paenibacillus sp. FSL R7-0331]